MNCMEPTQRQMLGYPVVFTAADSCQLVGCAGLIDQPFDTDASVASVEKYDGFSNPLAALLEVADG